MPREFENNTIWNYNKAEEFINSWIHLFESNPQTKYIADRYPIMGVYSHGETWAVKNYRLAVYYQNPNDATDSEYLVFQWAKLTRKNPNNEEEILMQLDCVYNTNHEKMRIMIPH